MNVSGSGFSWTLGPRGASLGIGQKGTYANIGIPGSGLYSRTQIGRGTAARSPSTGRTSMSVTVGVRDDGTVFFQDDDEQPLSDREVRAAKRQHGDTIRGLIQTKCDQINGQVEALGTLHLLTPSPAERPSYSPQEYDDGPPRAPVPRGLGLLGRLFKSRRQKIERENEQARKTHEEATARWQSDKAAFDEKERVRKDLIDRRIYADHDAMESFLEENLKDIVWPRETNVDFEVSPDGKQVVLDVDLPEIEDMPKRTASAPQSGYKLTVKEISAKRAQQLYLQHIHGIGFRIIGETFWALPTVERIMFSAYSQRPDRATGDVRDEYLYSVRVSRSAWGRINFQNLDVLDVVAALEQFDLRRDMKKTGAMSCIDPFRDGDPPTTS